MGKYRCPLIVAYGVLFLTASILKGAAGVHEAPAQPLSELNAGYYLLHHLGEDEANIPLLFLVKDAPVELGAYSKQIAKVAEDTTQALDEFTKDNPSIHPDKEPLPQIELDVRASIRDDKEQQLVFDTSGSEFIRAFLVTQIQASTYGINLCKVLAEKESNPQRAKTLQHLGAEWLKVRENAFRILRNY